MSRKLKMVPGKLTRDQALLGATVAALFLVFGATFAAVVLPGMDDSEGGLRVLVTMFFIIWMVVCGALLVFHLRIASNRSNNSIIEFEIDDSKEGADRPPETRT